MDYYCMPHKPSQTYWILIGHPPEQNVGHGHGPEIKQKRLPGALSPLPGATSLHLQPDVHSVEKLLQELCMSRAVPVLANRDSPATAGMNRLT